jgi:putative nucleotidyltransferase with HDIG domain
MSERHKKPSVPWFIATVIVAGACVIGHSLVMTASDPPGVEWFVLAALTLLTGSFTVKIPSQAARLSVSETFVFTSTLLFGAEAGTVTVVLDALVISFWLKRSTLSVSRVLFNAAAPAIAIWVAAVMFFRLAGLQPGELQRQTLAVAVVPLFVFALLYFVTNTALVAGALATDRNVSAIKLWTQNFQALSINYFVGASIAALLVSYTPRIDFTVLGIIIPIILISYTTFRTSMGRLEDARKHVEQLNDLYLSTIETLAMAVDAKDQITHGHIRRVQVYATELAKLLGVSDHEQLKGIEAAALLHDMGKLAIPEHILNKPGKLTDGEFEKMKRHADIGADLLSAIPFPYPVVPIVRHHHENWDGNGYPSGIKGTDIPLGARILSVVDCFDALTSDRPYRPRLSDEDAFAILKERRATMYDPLIVDTFIAAHASIAPQAIAAGQQAKTLLTGNLGPNAEAPNLLHQMHEESAATSALAQLRHSILRSSSLAHVVEAVAQAARQLTPASVVAMYTYLPQRDVLRCAHASGDPESVLNGIEIQSGQRTTGWAAANKRTITNSSAALDLPYAKDRFQPPLRSTLSVPICDGATLRGVLTLYSCVENAYSPSHQYLGEQLAAIIAEQVCRRDAHPEVVQFPRRPEVVRK